MLRNKVIMSHIKRRIDENKNALLLFVGDTGSGKSYANIRLFEKINPAFSVDFIEFEPRKFLQLINAGHPPGSCMMLDEVGVAMGARTWQSKFNIVISYVLQTFRFKRYVVGFTVPDLSFVDIHARKLFHYIVESKSIDHKKQICKVAFKRVQVNRNSGMLYKKCIRFHDREGDIKIAQFLRLKLPSLKLRNRYEKKREAYINNLYTKALISMDDSADKKMDTKRVAVCKHCGYEWETRVKGPKKCAACFTRGKITIKIIATTKT